MRSKGYCSWVCVCVCVYVSHLTSEASVHPENAVTYSADNEGQKICGVFSKTASSVADPAPPLLYGRMYGRPFFLRKARMHVNRVLAVRACTFCTISTRAIV